MLWQNDQIVARAVLAKRAGADADGPELRKVAHDIGGQIAPSHQQNALKAVIAGHHQIAQGKIRAPAFPAKRIAGIDKIAVWITGIAYVDLAIARDALRRCHRGRGWPWWSA